MANVPASSRHVWRFFRAGGFDQVRLDRGADLVHLDQLDQKLWVALACPVGGLEFDERTLKLIDTDHDGRIRAPDILAATKWALALLKDPDELLKPSPSLPLGAINDSTPEGKQVLASARQILTNLGRAGDGAIGVGDTTDTAKIFAATRFNGDGVIPPDAADDPAVRAVLDDVLKCLPPVADRSGKPGVNGEMVDRFFADCLTVSDWYAAAEAVGAAVLPLGDRTPAAAAAVRAVASKVDDYFARCRLAAYDARAVGALNRQESDYLSIAARDLTITSAEIAVLPLSRVEAGKPLPLDGGSLNPAWSAAVDALNASAVRPTLGERASLAEQEWDDLRSRFAAYEAWLARRPVTAVDTLDLARVREILASGARVAIADLLAQDKALEPEATAIADVDRLVRYHRDLYKLLNNFVNFRDFYARIDKAVFQAGTLYLDQRSCDLCIRVEDMARHGAMAHLSQTYLAYCDVTRKADGRKMTVACAFTAGDSDNLMVGRNGIFYDRDGRDWDATITKIVDNPISIRQAFWAPYKRAIRWIEEQIAKRAAAADAAAHAQVTTSIATSVDAPPAPPAAPAPAVQPKKVDVGVVAALGVAVGAITTALGVFLNWMSGTPWYFLPLYVALVMLAISLPSMVIAALKLRLRNLGPILDANGWAVNARARVNIPFGRALTKARALPPNSKRDLVDPYADSHGVRNTLVTLVVVAAAAWTLWYFGAVERVAPNVFPKSGWYLRTYFDPAANPS
jgi:hypothetical protein